MRKKLKLKSFLQLKESTRLVDVEVVTDDSGETGPFDFPQLWQSGKMEGYRWGIIK